MAKKDAVSPKRDLSDADWGLVYKFATALEKGRFGEYVSVLQNTRKLFWKAFVSGLGRGLGAVIGGTVIVALLAGLLAMIGPHLPSAAEEAVENTGKQIQQTTK